jgi:peptidoglycan/LPS O-acetylase OafA/YrhL
VTTHASFGKYLGRLEIGVSVFFLISGFLLYRPFAVAHFSGRPSPSVKTFWARRLLRVMPGYWLALTVLTYVFHAVTLGPGWQGVLANYALIQIYLPSQIFNGILQAWSVCTEMSFYLFLPLYAAAVAFRRPRSQTRQLVRELVGIAVLIGTSYGFRDWALNQPVHCSPNCLSHPAVISLTSAWLPSYLDLFALGILLAVASAWFSARQWEPAWLRHPLMPRVSWICAALTFWGVSNLGIDPQPIYVISPGLNLLKQGLYGLFAFFLLVPAVFGPQDQSAVRRVLRHWMVAAIGIVSYGIDPN